MAARKKRVPYEFVLEALVSLNWRTNPMFGCTAIYVDEKICFILRERNSPPADDGVWIATTVEHHDSLRRELPSIRSIEVFGPGVSGWQNIPADSPSFEREVLAACDLVIARDPRLGKVPGAKKPKKKVSRS
jgi:hypothetical protein